MAKRKYRLDLIQHFGSEEEVEARVLAYRREHQITSEQMSSGEWIPITRLKEICQQAGITNDGPNSTMVRAIGWDRALFDPWHPSLQTYYDSRGMRWFHKSSLTDGINVILSHVDKPQYP